MRAVNLCILPKLPLENAKRPWPADIVCHQLVNVGPDVLAWYHSCVVTVLCQNFFCHGHWAFHLHTPSTFRPRSASHSGRHCVFIHHLIGIAIPQGCYSRSQDLLSQLRMEPLKGWVVLQRPGCGIRGSTCCCASV